VQKRGGSEGRTFAVLLLLLFLEVITYGYCYKMHIDKPKWVESNNAGVSGRIPQPVCSVTRSLSQGGKLD